MKHFVFTFSNYNNLSLVIVEALQFLKFGKVLKKLLLGVYFVIVIYILLLIIGCKCTFFSISFSQVYFVIFSVNTLYCLIRHLLPISGKKLHFIILFRECFKYSFYNNEMNNKYSKIYSY